ncbi:Uncharacterized conserved protein [Cedecea davisae]|uniref:DUF488 domain-containing protein n=1 Tax=Cedecea davisae DSM 4568 TaxID=566551 RepID=S3J0E5_9ENTR|nr:DUF488 family protein [Cedecea davisae]EPF18211.1 hypothetical protein HMPREF0201_01622 [Cedecea davisae DSM 4568]SUX28126.1 Uncharacterized conserved protein [Cedecea davisae]
MIRCKRVYEAPTPEDGYRVLVDRLWPRGVKKTDLHYDEWPKDLTPSSALRKEFHSEAIDFTEFSRCYKKELEQNLSAAKALAKHGKEGTLTLLYGAKNADQNHALVLADFLRHYMD